MMTCAPQPRLIPATVLSSRRNFVFPEGAATLPSMRRIPNMLFDALMTAGTYTVKFPSGRTRPAKPLPLAVSVLPSDACHPKMAT
jgi:hypothetical protein